MTEPYANIYDQTWDHYDAAISPEYADLCFMPVRRLVEERLNDEGTSLLDLCCGTGEMAEMTRDFKGLEYLGLDVNEEFLSRARERMAGLDNFEFLAADFFTADLGKKFDIILLINGYHHFTNPAKSRILEKTHELLNPGGTFILYEMLITKAGTPEEFARVNSDFYRKRIDWMKETEDMNPKKVAAWENVCTLSATAEDEYKVDYDYLVRGVETAGFEIDAATRIWPYEGEKIFEDPMVGDFLFQLSKDSTK